MKNQLKIGFVLCAMVMSLSGCGEKTVTLTFMNGDAELGQQEVTVGKSFSGYEQYEVQEDAAFEGWFGTPTYLESSLLDMTTATFAEDTVVYGKFKSTAVEEDTRAWTICGTGSSAALSMSNWNNQCEDAAVTFQATGNAANEFVLTVDLCAGDQFQVIAEHGWDDQRGYGYLKDADATQFENGGGLSGSDATSNINVLMDGNYTITLTTNPADVAQDMITIVRNGD